ncbi:MAG TPA: ABC transporter substrate-binding protein [Candidatus Eisenbacteria bacterium]|jgi:peptide/nickel transport system substrate-binding protein
MTLALPELGEYGGRFVIGQTSSPKTFNPIMSNESSSNDVNNRLYAALMDYDNGAMRDTFGLARAYEMSADGLTYTWHLRRGLCFSDGHPLTAEDVLFTFEVAYDATLHPAVQDLLSIGGKHFEVSAPDSYTVVTRIAKPYANMLGTMASLYIVPKHVLEASFRRGEFASAYRVSTPPESIVTSGPWRVKQFVQNEKTVIAPNPYWYRTDARGRRLPYLDEVVFLIVPDQNTAALKFAAGDLDAIDQVKPEDYKTYADGAKAGDYTLHDLGPGMTTNFFWFNLNRVREAAPGKKLGATQVDRLKYAWFSNPVFRRAVSMAIDREAIIRGPFFGDAVKNWSTATAGNKTWYTPEVGGSDYNPEESKKLLASLGFKDANADGILEDAQGHALRFTLKTNSDNNVRKAMANLIKDDLARVGIDCLPAPVEFNTLITNLRQDFQYDAILLGLQSGVPPDPVGQGQNTLRSTGLTHFWNIKQPKPETEAEARIDQLVEDNLTTTDFAKRRSDWVEIQKLLNDECFVVWLPTQIIKVPVRNRFGNVQPTVIPHRLLWNIERVFMKARPGRA